MSARIIVLGGGLSGLSAAYRLQAAGLDPIVLEARDRVGGRAWRVPVGEAHSFDAGCEALDDAHTALRGLAGELGVATRRAEPWAGHDETPALEPHDLELYRDLEHELADLATRVDPLHPEDVERAGKLDAETVGSRLAARGASPQLLAFAEASYAVASASVPIARMSLLALAAKMAAGAAPNGLTLRFDGGPSALAGRLADALGSAVRLGAEAVAVEQQRDGVRVLLADGSVERGARAVVTIPLTLQRDVRFRPSLGAHRRIALARARYGEVVKAALAFDEPFWPEGVGLVTDGGLVYELDRDEALLGFFAGSTPGRSLARLGSRSRVAEVLKRTGAALGTSVPAPRGEASVGWGRERFSRGSYLVFGPGDLTTWGRRLAEPDGRVHFAGSEASALPSYMEGAILAAERAASEVLAAGG